MDKREIRKAQKESKEELKGYVKNYEFVSAVEIICCADACEVCKAVADKKYPLKHLKQIPLIPIDGCTHERRCICCYTPIVEEVG